MHSSKKKIIKNVRGKMLCKNPKCQVQIPIHTSVCKTCGFVNKKKSKIINQDLDIIKQINDDPSQIEKLSKSQFIAAKEFYSRALFEVSFVFYILYHFSDLTFRVIFIAKMIF